jgi:uncharacterized damage-inducible protein DinB
MTRDPRFPIGKFDREYDDSQLARDARIAVIEDLPVRLNEAVAGLSDEQIDTPYREGGWTVRQTVHHLADSHANSLIRFKLALTEDEPPTVRPYYEDRWAELADNRLPVEVSLAMITGIHVRWATLLHSMDDDDFALEFVHPETGNWQLDGALALYSWHSLHHTAHITELRERMGW